MKYPITEELIRAGQSNAGGWNKEQLAILGIAWPPKHGWIGTVIGKPIDEFEADRFINLKGQTKKSKRKN